MCNLNYTFFMHQLKRLGYSNVDGAEPCEEMFQHARKKNAYRKYFTCAAGENQLQMPINDGEEHLIFKRNLLFQCRILFLLQPVTMLLLYLVHWFISKLQD